MRRRFVTLLLVTGALLAGVSVLAPSAAAAPAVCARAGDLPTLPTPAQSLFVVTPRTTLVAAADALARDGRLSAAESLYTKALQGNAPDPRAGTGLAYVRAARLAARNIAESAQKFEDQRSPEAKQCFQDAVNLDRSNAVALAGLALGEEKPVPPADRWDAFFKNRIDPFTRLVVPASVILVVLLVLARALTSYLVPTSGPAWAEVPRRGAWGVGFVLLVFVSVQAVGLAVGAVPLPRGSTVQWLCAALGFLVLAVLLSRAMGKPIRLVRDIGAEGGQVTGDDLLLLAPVAAGFLALVSLEELLVTAALTAWSWAFVVVVAGAGMVLVSAARGQALRLLVQVKADGSDDTAGTAYVLARLQELGTSPPAGLKMPQQVDVDNLPSEALTSLPAGRIASAIASVLKAVLPATPWKAVIEGEKGTSRVVVTMNRNGSVVRTALVDAAAFLSNSMSSPGAGGSGDATKKGTTSDGEPEAADRGDLLTAAAAVVLTELARVHRELQPGLCGASRWESVAAMVVATKPPSTRVDGPDLRRELLAYAVQADPRNALAQLAYANVKGEHATSAADLAGYASGLTRLLVDIERQAGIVSVADQRQEVSAAERAARGVDLEVGSGVVPAVDVRPVQDATAVVEAADRARAAESGKQATPEERKAGAGYLPLRLRARHSLTAAWLNVAVQVAPDAQNWPVELAATNYGRMVALLRAADELNPDDDAFLDEMCAVAAALRRAFVPFVRFPYEPALPEPPRYREETSLESLHVLYDDSCRAAVSRADREALAKLERAVGLERYRTEARTDPCFATLRTVDGPRDTNAARFWDLVGSPAPAFTDLPPFGNKGSALRELGVERPQDLCAVTEDGGEALADALKVPKTVTAAWRAFARLAGDRPRRVRWLDAREMALLAALDIRDDDELRRRVPDGLGDELVRQAHELGLRPPDPAEVAEILVTRDVEPRPAARPKESRSQPGTASVICVAVVGRADGSGPP